MSDQTKEKKIHKNLTEIHSHTSKFKFSSPKFRIDKKNEIKKFAFHTVTLVFDNFSFKHDQYLCRRQQQQ